MKGQQLSVDHLDLNPMGQVPAFVHGGKVITQSVAIMEYLEEAFPQAKKLLPTDALLRAKVIQIN